MMVGGFVHPHLMVLQAQHLQETPASLDSLDMFWGVTVAQWKVLPSDHPHDLTWKWKKLRCGKTMFLYQLGGEFTSMLVSVSRWGTICGLHLEFCHCSKHLDRLASSDASRDLLIFGPYTTPSLMGCEPKTWSPWRPPASTESRWVHHQMLKKTRKHIMSGPILANHGWFIVKR